ncbi:NAD(P)H-dependent glycerol-3-phosphate dehydrogenase [Acidithiobacillus sulfuriphilus]|uniref:NAD(P)H-dependent glycerol-3-phosphate dehydrogenase n=1 Tax=Acidithiobacillus sulfuriphilus TaxID=1867749 RepID=UPI003F603A04
MNWVVLGAGHWGVALAVHLVRQGHSVRLWGRHPESLPCPSASGDLSPHFPQVSRPARLTCTTDLVAAVAGCAGMVLAVPSHAIRNTLLSLRESLPAGQMVVLASKGLELETDLRLDQVLGQILKDRPFAVISGPTFAAELVAGLPVAMTAASASADLAQEVARSFGNEQMRVYTSDDVAGVCLGGAIKNVLAIAAGISDGLGNGFSARAALITRGLAELRRLGTALGGRTETFMGLAGAGDLILTATSDLSRNRRVGLGLGRGLPLAQVLREIGQEAEGVRTAQALFLLAQREGVEMPITEQVFRVLYQGLAPRKASDALMQRELRSEFTVLGQASSAHGVP